MVNRLTMMQRFCAKVAVTDSCWQWVGGGDGMGYGYFWNGKRCVRAHRFSYETFVGPIAVGLQIDHLCRNRLCVNPEHLEPVTQKVNLLRGESQPARNAVKTHCVHGHEFTPENTYHKPGESWRNCRTCTRLANRKNRPLIRARKRARRLAGDSKAGA